MSKIFKDTAWVICGGKKYPVLNGKFIVDGVEVEINEDAVYADPLVMAQQRIAELEVENAQLKKWCEVAKTWLPKGWDDPGDDIYDLFYKDVD